MEVLITLAVIFAVLLTFIYVVLSGKVHVERSIAINATAERIFAEVNSLQKWHAWAPWQKLEPDADYQYSGPEEGEGCKAVWKGKKVGEGSQIITASVPHSRIETDLDFGGKGQAHSLWSFEEDGGSTNVTWGFDTDMGMNPIGRMMGMMMDKWIGADYEKGLNSLKEICES